MSDEQEEEKRYRSRIGPAILAQGFRPFFLAAGLWAIVALGLSFAMIRGDISLPTAFDPISWHIHELLFGYVAASVAGFLLTAIPNWTGRLPLHGRPLLVLALLWLAGRVAVAFSLHTGLWLAAAFDLAFLAALVAAAGREVIVGRNWRNLPVILIVSLLLLANALFHAEALELIATDGLGRRLAIAVFIMLISLIGGRVVPSFTRNWLVKQQATRLPAPLGGFDKAALVATALALVWWAVWPEGMPLALLLTIAAALQAARLSRWCGLAVWREPLLWVLHLGYAWIPVGLGLLAYAHWDSAGWVWAWPGARTAAFHALTVGAMATMTLAVMSRAILGHTGRPLWAGRGLTACYGLVTTAVLLRLGATVWDGAQSELLLGAAAAWIGAFALFLGVCGPMLVRRGPGAGS